MEMYQWDCSGHLIIRGVMDPGVTALHPASWPRTATALLPSPSNEILPG